MRIGFVSTYPPIECGIATYTHFLNDEIRRQGKETFVASQVGAKGEGVFPIYWPESISIAAQIFNTCAKITPDVIHIQHEFGLFGSQAGVQVVDLILRLKLASIPVVSTLHTVYPNPTHEEKILLRIIISECDAIIVHEEQQREVILKLYGRSHKKKIHVIPHGVRDVKPVENAKKMLGLNGKKVVLLCGYFRPNKQFHRIVELWPRVCEQVKDAVLVVAGKARGLEYADYQTTLFESVNKSPVNDRIRVFRGQFPQKTFDTIISASDITVLPYTMSGQSGVMAHYYAFGRPVVASRLPAFKASLDRSKGGILCDTDDDYVAAIVRLLNNDKVRRRMHSNIQDYVEDCCVWSKVVPQHFVVYEGVIQVPYGNAEYVYFG